MEFPEHPETAGVDQEMRVGAVDRIADLLLAEARQVLALLFRG